MSHLKMWMQLFRSSRGQAHRPLLILAAVLVIVGALISIIRSQLPPSDKAALTPFQTLGEVAAAETVKLVGDTGKIVVWHSDTGSEAPALDVQIKAFTQTLKKHPGITIVAVVKDPPDYAARTILSVPCFLELLRKYHSVDAVVLFAGVPEVTAAEVQKIGESHPKILSIALLEPPARALFDAGVLQTAITTHGRETDRIHERPTHRADFDSLFMVVTAETSGLLLHPK